MLKFNIPGTDQPVTIEHLVMDYNGTLAVDGKLIESVAEYIIRLSAHFQLHVLSADTFGKVAENLNNLPCKIMIIPKGREAEHKLAYINDLDREKVIAIGNGRNDSLMLKGAKIGIAVIQNEGAATDALIASDIVTTDVIDAFEILLNPLRLVATLRK